MASFASTGAEQTFVVPEGISSVHVVAVGGKGGGGNPNLIPGSGGPGGVAAADLAVAGGETLYVEVGGNGTDASDSGSGAPGFNGGGSPATGTSGAGGGGGASDVRTAPRAATGEEAAVSLASRLVVAGGGGGAGEFGGISGGAGGGASGSPGAPASCGGHGGTPNAGGAAGTGMGNATAGQPGTGGTGGNATFASGPGGGGLYGGGGGGDDCGGGGGSGGFGPGTSNTSFDTDASGTPLVTITYVVAPTVSLISPANGATYKQFGIVYAGYACAAGTGTTISSCAAPAANAKPINTSKAGKHTFTVKATDADGGTATASATYTVTARRPARPVLRSLAAPKSWTLAKGAVFRFKLNEPARVRITFKRHTLGRKVKHRCVARTLGNRHARKCTLMTLAGKLVLSAHTGANQVKFNGMLANGRKLRPGTYTIVVTATDSAGHKSAAHTLTFTVRAH